MKSFQKEHCVFIFLDCGFMRYFSNISWNRRWVKIRSLLYTPSSIELGIYRKYFIQLCILRRQLRNPHFFKKCCHFFWNQNRVSKNDNTFERNRSNIFLKWMDFSNCVKFWWAQCKFALTVSYPWNDDSSNGDFDPRILEQFVPQIDAIPKTNDISFNGNIIFTMQPRKQ